MNLLYSGQKFSKKFHFLIATSKGSEIGSIKLSTLIYLRNIKEKIKKEFPFVNSRAFLSEIVMLIRKVITN